MSKELIETLNDLELKRLTLLQQSEPLRARRAALVEKITPLEQELREVNKALKAIEQPRLGELMSAINIVERGLGLAGLRPCCTDEANRETAEQRDNITVQRCKVCSRNHYTLAADPVKIAVTGAAVGA